MASDDLVERLRAASNGLPREVRGILTHYDRALFADAADRIEALMAESLRAAVSAGGEAPRAISAAEPREGDRVSFPVTGIVRRVHRDYDDGPSVSIRDTNYGRGFVVPIDDVTVLAAAAAGGAPRALANGECSDHPGEPAGECWGCAARAYRSAADGGAPSSGEATPDAPGADGEHPATAAPAESVLRRLLASRVADIYGTSLEFRDDDGSWVYNLHLSDAEADLCLRLAASGGPDGETQEAEGER